jgi:hypothetical protein
VSGVRRRIQQASNTRRFIQDKNSHYQLPTEVDNHADTICAGANCLIECYTGEVCSVSPFLDEYSEQEDVRVCKSITAVT